MIEKTPGDTLELEIDGEAYVFASPRAFEFALTARTNLPTSKITALSRLTDDDLLREAEAIRAVEQRFEDALSGAIEDITTVGPVLKTLEPSIISHDNGWRSIICALNALDDVPEKYKKIALVKYTQYLVSRQQVVRTLYGNRHKRDAHSERPDNGSGVYRPPARLRETMLIDLNAIPDREHHETPFSRLPKGETVEVDLEVHHVIDLLLARHQCRILRDEKLLFIDESGQNSELHVGRNVVGRDASSDIVMNAKLRDVSRKHLIVESDGERQIKLTDISSHGTSLPPKYLDHTSI